MILNASADYKVSIPNLIPLTAFVGSLSTTIGGIRHARGIQIQVRATAFAGAGSYSVGISGVAGSGGFSNFLYSEAAYSTTVGARSYLLYPGSNVFPAGSGHTQIDSVLPETVIIYLRNSSAVPGNEVTAELSVTLIP